MINVAIITKKFDVDSAYTSAVLGTADDNLRVLNNLLDVDLFARLFLTLLILALGFLFLGHRRFLYDALGGSSLARMLFAGPGGGRGLALWRHSVKM